MLPRPALLLLDLKMPEIDGSSVLREIERSLDLPPIAIVVMTASDPNAETSSLPYPLLRKPFHVQALLACVTQYCPRLWDDEEPPTDDDFLPLDSPRTGETTVRQPCSTCGARAATRCSTCGDAFCSPCLDAGHGCAR